MLEHDPEHDVFSARNRSGKPFFLKPTIYTSFTHHFHFHLTTCERGADMGLRDGRILRHPSKCRLLFYVLALQTLFLYHVDALREESSVSNASHATIAFYITVSPDQLPLLRRLFDRVYHPDNLYLIDYDATIPERSFGFVPRTRNVYQRRADPFASSGVSAVLNVLDAMAFFFNREDVLKSDLKAPHVSTFDYFIPISPSSYPTVTAANLRTVLPNTLPRPSFLHFAHASQSTLFAAEVDEVHIDLTLSFSMDAPRQLYSRHYSHPDKQRRAFELPRAGTLFVASRSFARFAVESVVSKRLLLVLAETANVSTRFFSALAEAAPAGTVGPIIRTTSLHCTHSDILDERMDGVLPDYLPRPPSVDYLQNLSEPCLFVAPFRDGASLTLRNDIDKFLLVPPGTQGRAPGISYHETVGKKIQALLDST